jgi:hypothetical protein
MKPVARCQYLSITPVNGTLLIRDLKNNAEYRLSSLEWHIWELLDGEHSVEDIVKILSTDHNLHLTQDDVWKILDTFSDAGLLEARINPPTFTVFNNTSTTRRQFTRKLINRVSLGALSAAMSIGIPKLAAAQTSEAQAKSKKQDLQLQAEERRKVQLNQRQAEQSNKRQTEQSDKRQAEQSNKRQAEQSNKRQAEQSNKLPG